jgi:hypothetical protein
MGPLEVGGAHLHELLINVLGEGPPLRVVPLDPHRGLHQLLQHLGGLVEAGLEVLDAEALITGLPLLLLGGY